MEFSSTSIHLIKREVHFKQTQMFMVLHDWQHFSLPNIIVWRVIKGLTRNNSTLKGENYNLGYSN